MTIVQNMLSVAIFTVNCLIDPCRRNVSMFTVHCMLNVAIFTLHCLINPKLITCILFKTDIGLYNYM